MRYELTADEKDFVVVLRDTDGVETEVDRGDRERLEHAWLEELAR